MKHLSTLFMFHLIKYRVRGYIQNNNIRFSSLRSINGPSTSLLSTTEKQLGFDRSLPGSSRAIIPQSPLKVMVFMDGTWIYYSLVHGRDRICPIRDRLGPNWMDRYRIDWIKLNQIIESNLATQLYTQHNHPRLIEIIRTYVFTSTKAGTQVDSQRARMIADFHSINFEVQHLLTKGDKEKCVDIALAVEMLYMATVPEGYDIAVLVSGDKDFIPALQKTRLKGKRVGICSVRHSCNRDLSDMSAHVRDFDMIWLDDYIDQLFVPKATVSNGDVHAANFDAVIVDILKKYLSNHPNKTASSRDVGRHLASIDLNGKSALYTLKDREPSLRAFLEKRYMDFDMEFTPGQSEFQVILNDNEEDDEDDEDGEEEGGGGVGDGGVGVLGEMTGGDEGGTDDEYDESSSEGHRGNFPASAPLESMTVSELRALLKERRRPVSGRKDELILRLQEASGTDEHPNQADQDRLTSERLQTEDEFMTVSTVSSDKTSQYEDSDVETRSEDDAWILKLIKEFVDGEKKVSSRDIGRYLTIHAAPSGGTALTTLKRNHKSLLRFMTRYHADFTIEYDPDFAGSVNIFYVQLAKKPETI